MAAFRAGWALGVALAASGCAGMSGGFVKAGGTPEQMQADYAACREDARPRAWTEAATGRHYPGSSYGTYDTGEAEQGMAGIGESEVFFLTQELANTCMRERGYRLAGEVD